MPKGVYERSEEHKEKLRQSIIARNKSKEQREIVSKAKTGENNHNWKGQNAGYVARHERCVKARGKASGYACSECGSKAQEWAQLHETSGGDPYDYQPMCCSCHQKYDNHWNEETRNKVSESMRRVWADRKASRRGGDA